MSPCGTRLRTTALLVCCMTISASLSLDLIKNSTHTKEADMEASSARKRTLSEEQDAEKGSNDARRLAVIGKDFTGSGLVIQYDNLADTKLLANKAVTQLELIINVGDTYEDVNMQRKIKIVRASCAEDGSSIVEGTVWGKDGVQLVDTATAHIVEPGGGTPNLVFRMGGTYKWCYAHHGDFDDAAQTSILPVDVFVYGVYDYASTTTNLLADTPYNCYVAKKAYNTLDGQFSLTTTCVVNYGRTVNQGIHSDPTSGTWSPVDQSCGGEPSNKICTDGSDCSSGTTFLTPDATHADKRISVPPVKNDLPVFEAFKVFACYCPQPEKSSCLINNAFTQQIGVLYFFLAKVCDANNNMCQLGAGSLDFNGVTAEQRFFVQVECPTGGCVAQNENALKLVAQHANNELPQWDPANGCRTAIHGQSSSGRAILPEPANCDDATTCHLTGGSSTSVKTFGGGTGNSGFLFVAGSTFYERRNFHQREMFDVCYCDAMCSVAENWFKVGAMRFSPLRLTSMATVGSVSQNEFTVEYVQQPGTFGFERLIDNADTLGLQEDGRVRMFVDDDHTFAQTECINVANDKVSGSAQSTGHKGKLEGDNANEATRLVFNSHDVQNAITLSKAGVYAVCYCQFENQCNVASGWAFVARFTVRGPLDTSQNWEYSTNVVFRLEYSGWGLSDLNKIRITTDNDKCDDPSGEPTKSSAPYTFIKVECPYPCNSVGDNTDSVNGDLQTLTLSSQKFNCDKQHDNCRTNFIQYVEVISDTVTELTFEQPPGFTSGVDVIVLGDNINCGADCTAEQLASLKGVFDFSDKTSNHAEAPDTYMVGHTVTNKPESSGDTHYQKKVHIPIGWAGTRPTFTVAVVSNERGKWKRVNKAVTKEEIKGTKEKANLKVCWHYGTLQGKFVAEIGKLTLKDPHPMADARVSLTTTVKNIRAPIVISFATASGEAGKKYRTTLGSTQLKILFTQTTMLEVFQSDLVASEIDPNDNEDDIDEASQHICGKLFIELWSDDPQNGFPMPAGCYHRVYANGQRELYLKFDPKNGLKPGQNYQLVVNARLATATAGQSYVEIFTMDDVDVNPYIAIERGVATLNKSPENPAYESDGSRFLDPGGFKLVGGVNNIVTLEGTTPLRIELKGDAHLFDGGIKAGCIIRVFLWPLTQWKTGSSCDATCLTDAENSSVCGDVQDCKGEAVVANANNNILKVVMPANMDTIYGPRKQVLDIGGLTWPSGGVFLGRLAAQVTTPEDVKPYYVISAGDYIYKEPDEGQTVGKLVHLEGDGNHSPFRGDTNNELYAKIILSATLFSALADGNAMFVVTPPEGYVCKIGVADPGTASSWAAKPTLQVFGDEVPQGRGTIADGWSVSADGKKCIHSLNQKAVIFAGSSLMVKFTVDNPVNALQQVDPANRWTIEMTSQGYYSKKRTAPASPFKAIEQHYDGNVAVLGHLTACLIQPRSLTAGESYINVFFRTEQNTHPHGYVVVKAPVGFQPTVCEVANLEDEYYATGRTTETKPLPNAMACTFDDTTRFRIQMVGGLESGKTIGFRLKINIPTAYDPAHRTSWFIYTQDSMKRAIDGTKLTVPFMAGDIQSWGMYNDELPVEVNFKDDDMRPHSMTTTLSEITFKITTKTVAFMSNLKITLPPGYEWNLSNFVLGAAFPAAPLPVNPANKNVLMWNPQTFNAQFTYVLTVQVAVPDENVRGSTNAIFVEFGYDGTSLAERKYGSVVVPTKAGSNDILSIQSVIGATVDYSTNTQSKENVLSFSFRTSTALPAHGVMKVTFPTGFLVMMKTDTEGVESCTILPPNVETIPPTFDYVSNGQCLFERDVHTLKLTAGLEGYPAGDYRFDVKGNNPGEPRALTSQSSSKCGMSQCWSFSTFKGTQLTPVDMEMSIPGFPVNKKMLEAGLAQLTEDQMTGIKRNNRPRAQNNLIFLMKLHDDEPQETILKIRAPRGFIFAEECLTGVETREAEVFGLGNKWPPIYEVWPSTAKVTKCRGTGSDAALTITPEGANGGLKGEKLYCFRIQVQQNPDTTPHPNKWTIEYSGESAEPFDGFTLWTFIGVSINPVTTAKSINKEDRKVNPVTIHFTPFNTVHQDTPFMNSGGLLRVTAPAAFEFDQINNECVARIEEGRELDRPFQVWTESDLNCRVDLQHRNVVNLKLASAKYIAAGTPYTLILEIFNPSEVGDGSKGLWTLETFNEHNGDPTYALDEKTAEGFAINSHLRQWEVVNENDVRNGDTVIENLMFHLRFDTDLHRGGMVEIRSPRGGYKYEYSNCFTRANTWDIRKETHFVANGPAACAEFCDLVNSPYFGLQDTLCVCGSRDMADADVADLACTLKCRDQGTDSNCGSIEENAFAVYSLEFIGFNLESSETPGTCDNFVSKTVANPLGEWEHKVNVTCNGNVMLIVAKVSLEEANLLTWTLNTKNPSKTLSITNNFWTCERIDPNTNSIVASAVQLGWSIVPQLSDLKIHLLGARKSASSYSEIKITFTPVSDADQLRIEATDPPNFLFTHAELVSSAHEKIEASSTFMRLRMKIISGETETVRINKVRLGDGGGDAKFEVSTFLGVDTMDERLDFVGFRLPGRIDVDDKKLRNVYEDDPETYPVKSTFMAQMQTRANAIFNITLSNPVAVGEIFVVRAPGYDLRWGTQDFIIRDLSLQRDMSIKPFDIPSVPRLKDRLSFQLEDALLSSTFLNPNVYQIIVKVNSTPAYYNAQDRWAFETWSFEEYTLYYTDGAEDGDATALPTNTNDQMTETFPLVKSIRVQINAVKAPPLAEIKMEVTVEPNDSKPNELTIWAPPEFHFAEPCLVQPAPLDVRGCAVSLKPVAGRQKAILQLREDGITDTLTKVFIKVQTPAMTPSEKSWHIEATDSFSKDQVGWGEDVHRGFDVVQMRDTGVLFPGVPGSSQMTVKFTTVETIEVGGVLSLAVPWVDGVGGYEVDCEGMNVISLPPTTRCYFPLDITSNAGAGVASSTGAPRRTQAETSHVSLTHNNPPCVPPPTAVENKAVVNLVVNETLVPGMYAFSLMVTVPTATPADNTFSLMLFDSSCNVVDAAMKVLGRDVQPGLIMSASPLWWSRSDVGRLSAVTLGFNVEESKSSLGTELRRSIGEILINFPAGFIHGVSQPEHVTTTIQKSDLADDVISLSKPAEWLDSSQKDRLRISVNTPPGLRETGKYTFTFPVYVPAQIPPYNVWIVSICDAGGGCISSMDSSVRVAFPMAGFKIGQVSPGGSIERDSSGGAARISSWLATVFAILVAICRQ